jgi:tetratricopeptide (TPR) repeat protein
MFATLEGLGYLKGLPCAQVARMGVVFALVATGCATTPKTVAPVTKTQTKEFAKAPATPMQEVGADSLEPRIVELKKAEAAALAAPTSAAAWVQFGTLLEKSYRTQEAARAGWHAVELESTFGTWSALGNALAQGDVFMSMGGAMGAFQAFKMAAREAKYKEPGNIENAARNFLNLAHRDLQMGHDEQALELIKEAEGLCPDLALVYYQRALVFSAGGNVQEAKIAAQKALDLIAKQTPDQTPSDPELAKVQSSAASIVAGKPTARPFMQHMGEMLPDRFWEKPPLRGHSLELEVDQNSTRYFPLVPGVAMQMQVPTNWTHEMKATDKAVHLRMASPAGEQSFLLQITLFPVLRENFNLKEAAVAGRHGANAADTTVGPLLPIERKDGLAFWFATTQTVNPVTSGEGVQYKHLVQAFAYAKPFVLSASLLSQREDNVTKDSLLQIIRSFEVFRLDPAEVQASTR